MPFLSRVMHTRVARLPGTQRPHTGCEGSVDLHAPRPAADDEEERDPSRNFSTCGPSEVLMNTDSARTSVREHTRRPSGGAPDVSVVVPVYRGRPRIAALVSRIDAVMSESGHSYEVIIAAEGTAGDTPSLVRELVREGYPVRLLVHHGPADLARSVMEAFGRARGGILMSIKPDLSHPPEAIPDLLKAIEEQDAQVAVGTRYSVMARAQGLSPARRALNRLGMLFARPFSRVSDPLTGFFAFRRSVLDEADEMNPCGSSVLLELMVKSDCRRIEEIPITFGAHRRVRTGTSLEGMWKFVVHLKRLADYKFGFMSTLFQFLAVGGTGTVVDFASLGGLLALDVPIMAARALAIWVAMTWNFFLNRHFTFSGRPEGSILRQYGRFVTSCALGAFVNWGVFVCAINLLPGGPYRVVGGFLSGVAAGTAFNFALSHWWVFPHPPSYDAVDGAEKPD